MARLVAIFAGLLLCPLFIAPAAANTIATFSLTAALFTPSANDGVATGTFSLDLTTHTVFDASITTTNGALLLGASYPGFPADSYTPTSSGTQLVFHNSASALPGVAGQLLTLNFSLSDLTDLSSLPSFLVTGDESVYFFLCGGLCGTRGVYGAIETLSVATTPIPASLPLLATALCGIGVLGWRRQRTTAA